MNKLLQSIQHFARLTPDNIALRGSSARCNNNQQSQQAVQLSYAQLWQEINNVQQQLCTTKSQCLALRAENSIDWAILDLAALLAQITLIPIPMFFSEQQIQHVLDCSPIDTLVGDWQSIASSKQLIDTSSAITLSNLQGFKLNHNSNHLTAHSSSLFKGTAKITFTSGSTGAPKGVCLSQAHLQKVTQSLIDSLQGADKPEQHLVLLPLSTLLENITGVYVPLQMGLCSSIYSGELVGLKGSSQFDAAIFCQALKSNQPNSLVLTPALLNVLIQIGSQQPDIIKSLMFVAVGGAHVSPTIMQQAAAIGIPAYQGYGLSECASVVSLNTPTNNQLGSSGQPLVHCNISIAKDGEILVMGASMLGYLGQQASERTIKTGDIGYLDDNNFLHITGRKSNLLITSYGRNISPEWIESEAQRYPQLQQIVVMGDGQPALSAVVYSNAPELEVIDAITQLNATLPDYAKIATLLLTPAFNQYQHLLTANSRPIRANFNKMFSALIEAKSERSMAESEQTASNVKRILIKEQKMPNQSLKETDFFTQLQTATATAQKQMYQLPVFAACQRGDISLQTYYAFLTQAYHHVKHTVPLLMACGSRLNENYEWLRSALAQYIEEENGHQEWILNDINACGFDPELVRANQALGKVGAPIELMVAYLYHQIDRKNPLAFLGMVWVLEGTSVNVGGKIAQLVQHKLNLPDNAMSYLTSHSTLDQQHIKLFASLVNKITNKDDQQAIIDGANMVFSLYGQMLQALPLAEAESEEKLKQPEVCHESA